MRRDRMHTQVGSGCVRRLWNHGTMDMELLDFAIQSRTMVIHLSDNVLSVLSVVTADMIQQALCHIHSMVLSTTESSSEYLSHRGDCD